MEDGKLLAIQDEIRSRKLFLILARFAKVKCFPEFILIPCLLPSKLLGTWIVITRYNEQ